MKFSKYIILGAAVLGLSSCDSFLDRQPLDFGDENAYFRSDADFKLSANSFYEYLPMNRQGFGGLYSEDVNSDNQASETYNSLFIKGEKRTVNIKESEWNFVKLRNINFFINKAKSTVAAASGNEKLKYHYLGEGYFFRAWEYFRLLRNFGDVPILHTMQTDDRQQLAANSKRAPRNEVARFILADLDSAAMYMQDYAPESGRAAKGAALALKARVALYEGSWERYHAGTCFVPGTANWPGKAYNPDFKFKSGSAEAEVNYFLEQAYTAAEQALALHPMVGDMKQYLGLFNSAEALPVNGEAMLVRYYGNGGATHSCSAYLRGACGLTRALVNSFLMADGTPIYASADYQGDKVGYYELQGRDQRLQQGVRPAGNLISTSQDPETGKYVNDTTYYYRPAIYSGGKDKSTTGYELIKWLSDDAKQRVQYGCTTAVPLLRSSECALVYLEAYYMRHGRLDGNCDQYWRALRTRAGVDPDYAKTIQATDLSKENDLGVYSRGQLVDATLYNIRRERRCEMMAEGLRLDDLKRWRSLDNMVNYQVEGFNLWEDAYKMYDAAAQLAPGQVSQKAVSNYLRPLQVLGTSPAYDGYTFPKQHYLEPIPVSEFLLTAMGGKSPMYQNPGWPSDGDGTADYNFNCD